MKIRSGAALPAIVMIVGILAAATSVLRIWQISRWNETYRESFVAAPAAESVYKYDSGDEFDMSEFTLKHDIKYYDSPNGNVALTVQATNYLRPNSNDASSDLYGWVSTPTDVKGWRFTRHFGTESTASSNEFYVKLSDLQQAAKDAYGDSAKDSLDVTFKPLGSDIEIARTFTRAEYETLRVDFELYERGIMCSPDLEAPVWTTQTTFGAVAGVLLVGWSVVLFIMRFRDAKAQEENQ